MRVGLGGSLADEVDGFFGNAKVTRRKSYNSIFHSPLFSSIKKLAKNLVV